MRLPSHHASRLYALLMSCVMAFIMTAFVTWVNTGFDQGYPGRWMHAFFLAWPVAMLCILFLADRVRRLTSKLIVQ